MALVEAVEKDRDQFLRPCDLVAGHVRPKIVCPASTTIPGATWQTTRFSEAPFR